MKTEAVAFPVARPRPRAADFVSLAKPRLNFLVVVTTLVGYYAGAGDGVILSVLVSTVVGTALVAGGSAAFNQVYERDIDALMNRTRLRPLPDGRLQPSEATVYAAVLSLAGLVILALGAGFTAMFVAFATLASYLLVYTPLKRTTSLATVIGAVPGALPPVIGWAAARQSLGREAWVLFGIVFLWQMPHFLAIAWLYRDEYARAGIPLLPVIEPDGRSTARQVVAYASVLVPVSLLPGAAGMAGALYLVAAIVLGLAFLGLAVHFARRRDRLSARWLFFGSITYLPLLWISLAIDRLIL